MADIDMSCYTGESYNIIGDSNTEFTGKFNGNNHAIRNLTYTRTSFSTRTGLFGCIESGAYIHHLHLDNVNISLGGGWAAALVGYMHRGTFEHCSMTGSVISSASSLVSAYAGGLVGEMRYGILAKYWLASP